LAEVRGLEDHERGEGHAELGNADAEDHRDDEPHPEDHHHEGHAAEQLDVEGEGEPDPPSRREPPDADHDAEEEAEPDGGDGKPEAAAGQLSPAEEALADQERQVPPDDPEVADPRRPRAPALMSPGMAVRRSTHPMIAAMLAQSAR